MFHVKHESDETIDILCAMAKDIKAYSLPELSILMEELNQPKFRAKQLAQWLYVKHASSYEEMTNLPASLRQKLAESCPLQSPKIIQRLVSRDGTHKYLIEFADGVQVETVGIPSHDGQRLTVCFSTQAGCPMACSFCATGGEGFTRNLLPGEIVDQVLIVQEDMNMRVSNLVGMGQGEPFLNYDNVIAALHILNGADYLSIGARHITVSTCGILSGIESFSHEPEQFTMAVSLHAARQEVRDALMPKVASMGLPELKSALESYIERTNRRVTLEHIMIAGCNDSPEDFEALSSFCDGLLCHVNLIPLNELEDSPFKPTPRESIEQWRSKLNYQGIETTIRESRGGDIQGACGQLKNFYQ